MIAFRLMRSSPDRLGHTALIADDPSVMWSLLLVAAVALLLGCLLSGVPVRRLADGPLAYGRAVLTAATSRSETFFWVVWLCLSIALVAFAAAIVVAYAVFTVPR